jgi:hypothetical protein
MMKADDLRLAESLKSLTERVKKLDEFIVTVLKYNVSVEQSMTEFIEAHGKTADDFFSQKIAQCESSKPSEIDDAMWSLFKKTNRLRNAVAHKIDGPAVKDEMTKTRQAYAALSAQSAEDEKAMTDQHLVMSAFAHCGSFIIVVTEDKKETDKKQKP